jgi:predicted AlkP superfamily pyrophosphatase or phosphodiesterase
VPVWVSAGRAGLRSATLFWPGSEAQIDGRRPDDWLPYDERMPPGARVDQALAWLDRVPAQRPSFITLYFEQVDAVGHDAGPRSAAIDRAIAAVDRDLARLLAGLEARGLRDAVNLVVVSDHGMAATSPSRIIDLGRLLAPADASVRYWGTIIGVEPGAGRTAAVERALLRRHPHMECWRRNEIPARFRYGSNPRVAPIVCLAAVGWRISSHEWLQKNRRSRPGGAHGYDNQSPQMRAVFIAHGPAFRSNTVVDPIEARDVYGVLMAALGLPPEVPLAHPERSAAIRAPR